MRVAAFALVALLSTGASAFALPATVSSALIGQAFLGASELDFSVQGLSGIALEGQQITADIVFENEVVARVLSNEMILLIILHTDAGSFAGFPTNHSGFVMGLPGTQVSGAAGSSSGDLGVGLIPRDLRYADISGAHYEFDVPNNGHAITGATLRMGVSDAWGSVQFGTIKQLPEPGSLLLMLVGCATLGLARARRSLHRHA
jgi:hypothetical protein